MVEVRNGTGLPVAVGGIGGSGTRVVAGILRRLDYYLGDDLNEALDNLWFTLIFKRRSILLEDEPKLRALVALFIARMSENTPLSDEQRLLVASLLTEDRLHRPREWLTARASSFVSEKTTRRENQPWGWKEPNTHVLIETILSHHSHLRYVHVMRHPLDMACSQNQNQLAYWGSIFLDRDINIDPRTSLSYWCAAHRRIAKLSERWPNRILLVDFDALCANPQRSCIQLANFISIETDRDLLAEISRFVRPPESIGRFAQLHVEQFDSADLSYVQELGYQLGK